MQGTVKLGGLWIGEFPMVRYPSCMTTPRDPLYAGYRHPAEIISYAVWLYFGFSLSLRMVEEMLAARGISVTYETIRQWGLKFGREFANRIRRRAPQCGDKWRWCTRWMESEMTPAPVRYATTRWQRTDFGRPVSSIRFRTVTPMAASACWTAKPRARSRGP